MFRVILVDDEPRILTSLKNKFSWSKYNFELIGEYTSSTQAFEKICLEKPDVVFTDIRMPDIDGITLMKMVKEKNNDIEFVAISGFSEFAYAQEALRNHAFDYLLKPVDKDDADKLLALLSTHLKNKRSEKGDIQETGIYVSNTAYEVNENFRLLLKYVEENFDQDIHLKELADKFFLNPTYCSTLFNKITEKSFPEYITLLRMNKACDLLRDPNLSVSDICEKVGYKDYFYFSKVFNKFFGKSPKNWRKNLRR